MQTNITARNFELTTEIKDLAEENFESLLRYYDHIISCQLILKVEKHRKLAEIKTKVYGQTLQSTEESDNMNVSIEAAFDKARGQLKKYKGKLKHKDIQKINTVQSELVKPDTDVDSVDF